MLLFAGYENVVPLASWERTPRWHWRRWVGYQWRRKIQHGTFAPEPDWIYGTDKQVAVQFLREQFGRIT
jgi:hypothetical protein